MASHIVEFKVDGQWYSTIPFPDVEAAIKVEAALHTAGLKARVVALRIERDFITHGR